MEIRTPKSKYLLFVAMITLALPQQATAELIYQNDFQAPVGAEWSTGLRTTAPNAGRTYLGQFGNDNVSLTLGSIIPHTRLSLTFDLYVIGTWDGNHNVLVGAGPDVWTLAVAGGPTLLRTTFSNNESSLGFDRQAYPSAFGAGDNPAETGAAEIDTLGYTVDYGGSLGVRGADSVYRLSYSFDHSADSVIINFSGSGLEVLSNESWGIDSISIVAVPEPSSGLLLFSNLTLALASYRGKRRNQAAKSEST